MTDIADLTRRDTGPLDTDESVVQPEGATAAQRFAWGAFLTRLAGAGLEYASGALRVAGAAFRVTAPRTVWAEWVYDTSSGDLDGPGFKTSAGTIDIWGSDADGTARTPQILGVPAGDSIVVWQPNGAEVWSARVTGESAPHVNVVRYSITDPRHGRTLHNGVRYRIGARAASADPTALSTVGALAVSKTGALSLLTDDSLAQGPGGMGVAHPLSAETRAKLAALPAIRSVGPGLRLLAGVLSAVLGPGSVGPAELDAGTPAKQRALRDRIGAGFAGFRFLQWVSSAVTMNLPAAWDKQVVEIGTGSTGLEHLVRTGTGDGMGGVTPYGQDGQVTRIVHAGGNGRINVQGTIIRTQGAYLDIIRIGTEVEVFAPVGDTAGIVRDGDDRLLTHTEEVKLRALDLVEDVPRFAFPVDATDSEATVSRSASIRTAEGAVEFTPDTISVFRSVREIAFTGAVGQSTLLALREVRSIVFLVGGDTHRATVKAGTPVLASNRARIDAVLDSAGLAAVAPTSGAAVTVGVRFQDGDGEDLFQSGLQIKTSQIEDADTRLVPAGGAQGDVLYTDHGGVRAWRRPQYSDIQNAPHVPSYPAPAGTDRRYVLVVPRLGGGSPRWVAE